MRNTRIAAIAAAIGLMVVAGCGDRAEKPGAEAPRIEGVSITFPREAPQLASIASAPVEPARPRILRLPGRLVWDETRTSRLYPAFAGRVVKIMANPGDAVQAGQVLALLASPDFGQAQAEAHKAAAGLAEAEKALVRTRELVANGVAAQKDLIAAEADFARAQAEAAQARGRVKLYGTGETVDGTFALRSPIAGTVVERNINPGQELRPDLIAASAPAMFVVSDPARLWLVLDATERDLSLLERGRVMRLRVAAYPGEQFGGTIETVADFVDPQTRTVKVRGSVVNADRRLKGEMYVTAEAETAPAAGVAAPAKSVFLVGNRSYVFIDAGGGRFERVEVATAGESAGWVAVTSGLALGQRVVIEGELFLQHLLQAGRAPGAVPAKSGS